MMFLLVYIIDILQNSYQIQPERNILTKKHSGIMIKSTALHKLTYKIKDTIVQETIL